MSSGWCFLAASILMYGLANFLQSVAAIRLHLHAGLRPGLLIRLAGNKIYLSGLACQLLAFLFAFLARADLPLFLVQTAVAAGLGVTAVLGVLLLKWRLPGAEVGLLVALGVGLTALILAAEVGPSRDLRLTEIVALAVAVPLIGLLARTGARLSGAPGSVVLGALAGLSFGAVAIASRSLANAPSWSALLTDPLLLLVLAHAAVGQLMLGMAMQRGSITAAVAAMDFAAAIPPSAVGLLVLGDRIVPGRGWLAFFGFVLTLGSVLLLTRYAEPQHHVREMLGAHPQPSASNAARTASANRSGAPPAWPRNSDGSVTSSSSSSGAPSGPGTRSTRA